MMVPSELVKDALAACQAELDKANAEIILLKQQLNEALAIIDAIHCLILDGMEEGTVLGSEDLDIEDIEDLDDNERVPGL